MERLELIEKATKLAHEKVSGTAYCGDKLYEELSKLPEQKAVEKLAAHFLEDAKDNLEQGF